MSTVNRHKILNDPVYGFVTLRHERALDLMDHRYMQRLRRISQLGLSHLVYPGAVHNRFHHAVGCMHLMQEAIDSLRNKGVAITEAEAEAACLAILLHDVGHGPVQPRLGAQHCARRAPRRRQRPDHGPPERRDGRRLGFGH